jgi:energy-coupling factor transport system ATP-binding protein
MSEYAEHSPHFLSGGQKQRVSIAGVLAMKTDIIVLDEPTAMLDPIGRREVLSAVSRLNKEEGMTVILITHYMEEAALADRIIVMDGGGVVMDAAPREAFSQAGLLRSYGLDVPQVTEIGRRLREAGYGVPEGILSVEELTERLISLNECK